MSELKQIFLMCEHEWETLHTSVLPHCELCEVFICFKCLLCKPGLKNNVGLEFWTAKGYDIRGIGRQYKRYKEIQEKLKEYEQYE